MDRMNQWSRWREDCGLSKGLSFSHDCSEFGPLLTGSGWVLGKVGTINNGIEVGLLE